MRMLWFLWVSVFSKSSFKNKSGQPPVAPRPRSGPGVFLTKPFFQFLIPDLQKDGFWSDLKARARGLCSVRFVISLIFFGNLDLIPPNQIKMHCVE